MDIETELALNIVSEYGKVLENNNLYLANENELPYSKATIKDAIKKYANHLIEENGGIIPIEEYKVLVLGYSSLDEFIPINFYLKFIEVWEEYKKNGKLSKETINSNKDILDFLKKEKDKGSLDEIANYIKEAQSNFSKVYGIKSD